MLTIGQLASYARVTVRAVRHYHQVGLLPEPERNASGYRTYGADAVVRLIRIRTLADAGVPLARVRALLDADPATFADATADIDRQLRDRIRSLQEHRRRIARLGSGEALAVPAEVVDYLDRLRALGAPEAMIEPERDAWLLMAAQLPDKIPALMADKVALLSDPDVVRMYQLFALIASDGPDGPDGADRRKGGAGVGDDVLTEAADLLDRLFTQAEANGELDGQDDITPDPTFVQLMDSFADGAHPAIGRLRAMLAERGWTGWTRVARA